MKTKILSHLFLIAFIFILLPIARAEIGANLSVSFDELTGHEADAHFVFAVIRPAEDTNQPTTRENHRLANELLSQAHNWSLDQIRDRYTHHPAEKFEAMRRAGVKLSSHSAFIVVYRRGDYAKPVGTLWTAYPDAAGRIDLERSLDWTFPRK